MNTLFNVKHNAVNINSVMDFCRIKGSFSGTCKNVQFQRIVGSYPFLLKDISEMDIFLSDMNNASAYYRVTALPKLVSAEDISFYSVKYEDFLKTKKMPLKHTSGNSAFEEVLGNCAERVFDVFSGVKVSVSETIKKNFCIKLMFWMDYLLSRTSLIWNEGAVMKVASQNVSGVQEYLFYYFLTLAGFDVLLIQCECDIDSSLERLGFSACVNMGKMEKAAIPEYTRPVRKEVRQETVHKTESSGNIVVKIPERNRTRTTVQVMSNAPVREKSLEELAKLASSVVMIGIHDADGKAVGSGSGIMIGRNGFILTNNHVANGGRFFSDKIEDDDNIYKTDEIIKYNSVQDLAIIRIDRTLSPIPVYKGGTKLVRGQRVVAIGSPLGLFNTVSDGIISGFRNIKSVDMIQFTAPISHGSSGGALLNMNGELIGISTAGIDEGQNINLAMGYECINLFVKGFI